MGTFNPRAAELIEKRDFDAAARLLEESLSAMPEDWKPIQDFSDEQYVACWNTALRRSRAAPPAHDRIRLKAKMIAAISPPAIPYTTAFPTMVMA